MARGVASVVGLVHVAVACSLAVLLLGRGPAATGIVTSRHGRDGSGIAAVVHIMGRPLSVSMAHVAWGSSSGPAVRARAWSTLKVKLFCLRNTATWVVDRIIGVVSRRNSVVAHRRMRSRGARTWLIRLVRVGQSRSRGGMTMCLGRLVRHHQLQTGIHGICGEGRIFFAQFLGSQSLVFL